jgi:two-component system cell cycle sensor histidine kinase/response regulator CckA
MSKTTRVVIVEDQALTAVDLEIRLNHLGYQVVATAFSGAEALERIPVVLPDLILMDIDLGDGSDGVHVAEEIRRSLDIPVVFLTAFRDARTIDRAKRTEPFGYLVKPVNDENLSAAVEIALHKHKIERKLRQREAWLTTTLGCTGDGVIVTDADGRVEFLNDAAKKILGADSEPVGQYLADVVRLKSRITDAPTGDLVRLAILQGSTMDIGRDLVVTASSGQLRDVEGEIALSKVEGLIVGTVLTFRDVTVRMLEDQHRSRELRSLAVARVAGSVSGELNTLLGKTLDYSGEALRLSGGNETLRSSLEAIQAQTQALGEVSNQLSKMSRRTVSFPCPMDLNGMIAATCIEHRREMPLQIELDSVPSPDLLKVWADPEQIKQVLASVIHHACDSLPNGGRIQVQAENSGTERHNRDGTINRYVMISVGITGAVAAPSTTQQWFEPFTAAYNAEGGLDLRLLMVQGIIADARGSIRLAKKPGQGAVFEILLPACEVPGQGTQSRPDSGGSEPTILLVDADHDIRSLLGNRLEASGYELLGARNAKEALEWLELCAWPIDILITPFEMPEMNGSALAERVSLRYPRVKILFRADSLVDATKKQSWVKKGARFLTGPLRQDDLVDIVRETLQSTTQYAA